MHNDAHSFAQERASTSSPVNDPRVRAAERRIIEIVRSGITKGAQSGRFLTDLTRAVRALEAAERRAGAVRAQEPSAGMQVLEGRWPIHRSRPSVRRKRRSR